MKAPLLIVLGAVVLLTGSGLAIMNDACKSSHHAWCAPMSGSGTTLRQAQLIATAQAAVGVVAARLEYEG
jgi:hypothetical protein